VAVLLLVVAGVIALTQGDDEASTVTAERDTTSSELPSTTTTSESPGTTTTSESPSTIETAGGLLLEDLRVGDCFDDSGYGTPEVGEITRVDCDVPHDSEVFGLPTLPGGPGAPYPGEDEIDRLSSDLCLREFASYVGIDFEDSMWEFDYFGPPEETWRIYEDRLVICALTDHSFNKIEGSKRNSRT
jgi:Septum formation